MPYPRQLAERGEGVREKEKRRLEGQRLDVENKFRPPKDGVVVEATAYWWARRSRPVPSNARLFVGSSPIGLPMLSVTCVRRPSCATRYVGDWHRPEAKGGWVRKYFVVCLRQRLQALCL